MTTYSPISGSPFTVASAPDITGRNPGNLTTAFTQNLLGTMPAKWEWFRGAVGTATPGVGFTPAICSVYRNTLQLVSTFYPNGVSTFDPSQPIPFSQGDEIYFYWALASSVTPVPVVTIFLRYDLDLPANQGYRG